MKRSEINANIRWAEDFLAANNIRLPELAYWTPDEKLDPLRAEARRGRDALVAGDLKAFGEAMVRNTAAQANLNAALVSEKAMRVFAIARRHGALGWKVNGAGGDGGSVTILSSADANERREMLAEIAAMGDGIMEIGIRLDNAGTRIVK